MNDRWFNTNSNLVVVSAKILPSAVQRVGSFGVGCLGGSVEYPTRNTRSTSRRYAARAPKPQLTRGESSAKFFQVRNEQKVGARCSETEQKIDETRSDELGEVKHLGRSDSESTRRWNVYGLPGLVIPGRRRQFVVEVEIGTGYRTSPQWLAVAALISERQAGDIDFGAISETRTTDDTSIEQNLGANKFHNSPKKSRKIGKIQSGTELYSGA
ncbi:hypothetical protein C8R45DRAFT_934177 [Mycena sanguinolenta]|nr:hypothetical protein C8R45DRAFT_934177 [Mycena sanguinolenta]